MTKHFSLLAFLFANYGAANAIHKSLIRQFVPGPQVFFFGNHVQRREKATGSCQRHYWRTMSNIFSLIYDSRNSDSIKLRYVDGVIIAKKTGISRNFFPSNCGKILDLSSIFPTTHFLAVSLFSRLTASGIRRRSKRILRGGRRGISRQLFP